MSIVHPNWICARCGTWLFDSQQLLDAAVEYDGQVIETPGVCPECDHTALDHAAGGLFSTA